MEQKTNTTTNQYLKTKVMTASPEQLQLMLYDGAIRFCEQGRAAIEENKIEDSYKLISRAESIVMEMCKSLRDEFAPDTCANMRSLYIFCYEKLVNANMKKDVAAIDEALKILRHMRETWVLLIDKLKEEQTAQQPSVDITDSIDQLDDSVEPQAVAMSFSIEG